MFNLSCLFLVVLCPPLTAPANGELSSNETIYNIDTTLHFTCNECYNLTNEGSLTCLPSGSWNYEVPVCTRKYV